MRNWIVAGLLSVTAMGSGCQFLGDQIGSAIAVTQLKYEMENVNMTRFDVPLLAQNPSADFVVTIKASNPNTVAANLNNLTFDMLIDSTKVGTGSLAQPLAVDAGAAQSVGINVNVPYTNLPSAIMAALTARKANITLTGTSNISTPLGNIPVPVSLTQTFSF